MADNKDKVVQLPDGRVVSFPSTMSDDEIGMAIKTKILASPEPPELQKRLATLGTQSKQQFLTKSTPKPEGQGLLEQAQTLATDTAQKRMEEDLRKGTSPTMTGIRQFAPNALADIIGGIRGAASPTGLAIGAGAALAPEIVGPALMAHGALGAYEKRKALVDLATTGQANPEEIQQGLLSLSEIVGGRAGTRRGPLTKLAASKVYTPTGELTPGAQAVAHPIGRVQGAGPSAGEYLLKKIVPESPSQVTARQTYAKTKTIVEAQEAAGKQNVAVDRLAAKKATGDGPEPLKPYRPLGKNVDLYRSTKTAEAGVPKGPSHVGAPKPIPAREVVPVTPASELPVYEGPYKPGPSARLNRSVSSSAPVGKSYENRGLLQSRPGGMAPAKPSPSTAEAGEAGRYGMNKGAMGWEEQKVRSIVNATTITPSDYVFMTRRFGPNWRKMSAEQLMGHASASRPPRVE